MPSSKRFNRYKQKQKNKDSRVEQPDKAMQRDLDGANLREAQTALVREAVAALGIGERVVAVAALKPGIPWLFPIFDTTKEGIKGPLQTQEDILKDLGVYLLVLFP